MYIESPLLGQAQLALMLPFRTATRGANIILKTLPTINTGNSYRQLNSMATPYKIHLIPEDSGLWKFDQTVDAANKASELLQKDLEVSILAPNQP